LAAIDALIDAANLAQQRNLPRIMVGMVGIPSVRGWKELADELQSLFSLALPDQPKAAAYRFIVAVVPILTGEHPTLEAVQTALKKKRYADRGKLFF
jgi:hypothetical protein